MKEERISTSVDLAKVALHMMITKAAAHNQPEKWAKIEGELVNRLVKLGFDRDASFTLFDELHEKYVVQKYKLRQKFKTPENSRYFKADMKIEFTVEDDAQVDEG